MTRGTYLDRRWPNPRLFQEVAVDWCKDQSRLLLTLVWQGYDRLKNELTPVQFSARDEAKEETLNYLLAGKIEDAMDGFEPFRFSYQPPETAKRKRGRGKSPTPDHGFVLRENPRSIWSVEGKVLLHDRDVNAYVSEVRNNFLSGRYATFSREGAMLGYLLKGSPIAALDNVAARLKAELGPHPFFRDRPHRISIHARKLSSHRKRSEVFSCHHLILAIAGS